MTKKQKAELAMHWLDKLFPEVPIPVKHDDAFTLLIAVMLSAQCTDERVNQITPLLFSKAASPQEMLKLSVAEIEAIIRPCGLAPAKSKAIWNTSRLLLEQFEGMVPDRFEALESLPGVGHKTASVVMSQAFGVPAFPVDTHIQRLMYRWGLSDGSNVKKTEADAKKLFPRERWNKLHLQIIYYARAYSPARGFQMQQSPIDMAIGVKSRY